jgi:hypothetical protein
MLQIAISKSEVEKPTASKDNAVQYNRILQFLMRVDPHLRLSAISIAPIRTRPRRVYDEALTSFAPEGEHIPRELTRIFGRGDAGVDQREAILAFGKESGLFNDLSVKRLGRSASDPFQVRVTVAGPDVNMIDVGYGVSQSLPVVVQTVISDKSRWLLLQQPEVHLHPKAQAALGSFFARLAGQDNHKFVIETHSDFIIDRVRQEVCKGAIPKEMVTILFFEKPGLETKVTPIHLDELGNIVDPPPAYRDFFLHEEMNLLGGASK